MRPVAWPSGLRRWFRHQSFYGVGSNPTSASCGLFTTLTCETCHAFSFKLLREVWQVVQLQLL